MWETALWLRGLVMRPGMLDLIYQTVYIPVQYTVYTIRTVTGQSCEAYGQSLQSCEGEVVLALRTHYRYILNSHGSPFS